MAGLYLDGAWLIVQVAETLLPIYATPGRGEAGRANAVARMTAWEVN